MTKIKNITEGPKVINASPAYVMQAGEEHDDFVISDEELASARKTGWFEIDGVTEADTSSEPGPLDGSVEDLTAHLTTVSDADEVQKLIDAETAGKSRKGALAALEARRDELLK